MCRLLYYRDAKFKTGNQFVGLVILSGKSIVLCTALNGGYIDSDLHKQNAQVGKIVTSACFVVPTNASLLQNLYDLFLLDM